MLFDSHAHYDDEKFNNIRAELLSNMPEYGVTKIVNSGSSLKSSLAAKELAHQYDFIYFTAGVHPEAAVNDTKNDGWLSQIQSICNDEKCVAIGEIGLDYHWEKDTAPVQKQCFEAQLQLCEKLHLPAVVHDRDAHGDCLEIIKKHPNVKGLLHCFSGSVETARELLSLGWYISVGGVVTFKSARKNVEVIQALKDIPNGLSKLLLETDCPYLAPVPHRGELNHSGLMKNTAAKVAEILNLTVQETENLTYNNAIEFFGIN